MQTAFSTNGGCPPGAVLLYSPWRTPRRPATLVEARRASVSHGRCGNAAAVEALTGRAGLWCDDHLEEASGARRHACRRLRGAGSAPRGAPVQSGAQEAAALRVLRTV